MRRVPHDNEHPALLRAAQHELAVARLSFLRDPGQPLAPLDACARLEGPEGQERLEQAVRDGLYPSAELSQLPSALAELARGVTLQSGRRTLGRWYGETIHAGGGSHAPAQLLAMLALPTTAPLGLTSVVRALGGALDPHVGYWLDLEERARSVEAGQLAAAERVLPRAEVPSDLPPPVEPAPSEPEPLPSVETLAQSWLAETDDAAHELGGWLVKQSPVTAGDELARLWISLRAVALDGLSRPQRRFHRLAEGARRLGFEREMNARMHGETAAAQLVPLPSCVSTTGPAGVRVLQPGLEYGWLSDLAVAQGMGEGLAQALVSPALGPATGSARASSVARALGALWLQLRAERGYLQRVDGIDARPAGQLARQTGLWLLFRVRLAAALCVADEAARSQQERRALRIAASQRALGRELPESVLALLCVQDVTPAQTFEALLRGCELHAALRERYDSDFYSNPRVSEVLRGAAARGSLLSAADWSAELAAEPRAGLRRLLELVG